MKKKIIALVSAAAMFSGIAAAAYGTQKNIDVTTGVSVFMDNEEIDMRDVDNNKVDAFVYDGTTYLPARAISEANGKKIDWDGENGRVYITTPGSARSRRESAFSHVQRGSI